MSSTEKAASAKCRWGLYGWRVLVFLAILFWPLYWGWQVYTAQAGPDPGNFLLLDFGFGTLRLLLILLLLSPLYLLTRWQMFNVIRRQIGLWCFTFAVLHFASYLLFIIGLSWESFVSDLTRRPYIIVGMIALVGLTLMAATSLKLLARRLGKYWKRIHSVVYPVLLLGLLHFFWIVRADMGQWGLYALAAIVLLLLRLPFFKNGLIALHGIIFNRQVKA